MILGVRFFDFSKNIGLSIGNSRSHRNYAWPIEILDFNPMIELRPNEVATPSGTRPESVTRPV